MDGPLRSSTVFPPLARQPIKSVCPSKGKFQGTVAAALWSVNSLGDCQIAQSEKKLKKK